MRPNILAFIILCTVLTIPADTAHKMTERQYQKKYCTGTTEYILPDKTRIDCLTDKYAIEFDFAPNWAESLGQALHYARMTGRTPAIYIIIESDTEYKYIQRLQPLCEMLKIKLFLIQNTNEQKKIKR